MDLKFDGSFYYKGVKLYYRVVNSCCFDVDCCEYTIQYFDMKDFCISITKFGSSDEIAVIDPIKAMQIFDEGENNGK